MNIFRLLAAIAVLALAGAASAQDSQRGSTPPGKSQDGSAPSDGAIKGGTILPGESAGMPDGRSRPDAQATERAARCVELQGTLRDQCLEQESRAGTGATKDPVMGDTRPMPETAPPQNPR